MNTKKFLSAIVAAVVMLASSAELVGNASVAAVDMDGTSQTETLNSSSAVAESDPTASGGNTSAPDESDPTTSGGSTSAPDESDPTVSGGNTSAPDESAPTTSGGNTPAPDESDPTASGGSTSAPDESDPATSGGNSSAPDESDPATSGGSTSTPDESAPSTSGENTSAPDDQEVFAFEAGQYLASAVKYVPYSAFLKTNYSDEADKIVTFTHSGGELPNGIALNEKTGELYGAPLDNNYYSFSVTAVCGEETATKQFSLSVSNNFNYPVGGKTDTGYEVVTYVGKTYDSTPLLTTTSSPAEDAMHSSGTYRLTLDELKSDQKYVSKGEYEEFVKLWLNGRVLERDMDYTAVEGSTIITLKSQTLQGLPENSLNTLVAEFRFGKADVDKSLWEMKLTPQNLFIGMNGTKTSSDNPPVSVPDEPNQPDTSSTPGTVGEVSEPDTSSKPSETETHKEQTLSPKIPDNVDEEIADIIGSITMYAPSGVLPNGAELTVMPDINVITDTGIALDFTILLNGETIQPNGEVTVQVNIPEKYKGKQVHVFHIADNKYTLVKSTVKDDKIVFTTDHFSTYVISDKVLDESGKEVIEKQPEPEDTGENPVTGVSTPAFGMIASGAALFMIFSSKKK